MIPLNKIFDYIFINTIVSNHATTDVIVLGCFNVHNRSSQGRDAAIVAINNKLTQIMSPHSFLVFWASIPINSI